jgi:uncharacterized membrane protein
MDLVDTALRHATDVAAKALGRSKPATTTQSVTIGRPRGAVRAFFRDPERLARVFGDIADVTADGDNLRWTFRSGEAITWECRVEADDDHVRYVSADGGERGIVLELRDAPRDRGTEVLLRETSPVPSLLAGALAFTALYRARALLQTGEVPTLEPNPSARASDR